MKKSLKTLTASKTAKSRGVAGMLKEIFFSHFFPVAVLRIKNHLWAAVDCFRRYGSATATLDVRETNAAKIPTWIIPMSTVFLHTFGFSSPYPSCTTYVGNGTSSAFCLSFFLFFRGWKV